MLLEIRYPQLGIHPLDLILREDLLWLENSCGIVLNSF